MSESNASSDKLKPLLNQLNQEAKQEDELSDSSKSFLSKITDQDKFRNREREYTDLPKHWVRRYVWLAVAKQIAKETQAEYQRGIRYLTLPSKGRLDVSLFLRENLLEMRSVENASQSVVGVAAFEAEPTKFGLLTSQSPRFELLGLCSIEDALVNPKNEYYDQLRNLFPFDIVNLDLTSSLTPQHEGPYSKTMQAIEEVLSRQASHRTPWALFLTFRNVLDDWEEEALKQFLRNLEENLSNSPRAKEAFYNRYNVVGVDSLQRTQPLICISQAVAKWLVDRAHSHALQMQSIACYQYERISTGLSAYQICKHVIVFSRGQISPIQVPTKGFPRQSWMEDNWVTCIDKHRPIDVQSKLEGLKISSEQKYQALEMEIAELLKLVSPGDVEGLVE
jgi:hypothetical protein